ncbi:MAG: glycine--tRNA ligase subunit beta [Acidimicrobiia bacterium]|nr:glycine--tRNA ligase subunit beta [Acidimicrobiia bacterium]
MDRELLVEIGCEEMPASWLPGLTAQLAERLGAVLAGVRLETGAPIETFSTPRRLTARVASLAERQEDHEEFVLGPPVSAAFKPDGQPTPAASGFARKHGLDVGALERTRTPKGEYLACRLQHRGRATVDVLGDVMTALLRQLSFPKQMRWDAYLDDGRGALPFGRPIRWLVLMYGGRVVPFVIRRSEGAQGPRVQDVRSGSSTYGHRFLTTSGRAGRVIRFKTFDEYRTKLIENFVILEREERDDRIRRQLEGHARRLGGRVGHQVGGESSLLREVPDLVEYPSVVAGHFAAEFLKLPEEVLTTTMVHHQHFFPVVDDAGRLKPAFLAVVNMEVEKPEVIARNAERVLAARLRDAQFFWEADRRVPLASRVEELSTILFHKGLGDYRAKAERVAALSRWIAAEALGQPGMAAAAEEAGRLVKADLATGMVRELTELQGTMGGVYAREEGLPEAVWRAVYHHYLPVGVEADAPPTCQQLGAGAVTWAAVSLADKIDSVVGMLSAGERPTGSRDPLGIRRQAQGIVRLLADLDTLTGLDARPPLASMVAEARRLLQLSSLDADPGARRVLEGFLIERVRFLMSSRGLEYEEVQAATSDEGWCLSVNVADLVARAEAVREVKTRPEFQGLAEVFRRAKNIVEREAGGPLQPAWRANVERLAEPAEHLLRATLDRVGRDAETAMVAGQPLRALTAFATLRPAVERFFADVRVVVDDAALKTARLSLLAELRDRVLQVADISILAPKAE